MSDQFTKFYVPAAGKTVLDPSNNQPLPAEGKTVKGNKSYWTRREADCAVKAGAVPKSAKAK